MPFGGYITVGGFSSWLALLGIKPLTLTVLMQSTDVSRKKKCNQSSQSVCMCVCVCSCSRRGNQPDSPHCPARQHGDQAGVGRLPGDSSGVPRRPYRHPPETRVLRTPQGGALRQTVGNHLSAAPLHQGSARAHTPSTARPVSSALCLEL